MTHQDFNINCAEFLGFEYYLNRWQKTFILEENNHRTASDLHYHSDWNWLMEVVEKIESLESGIFQVDILQEGCAIRMRCKSFIDCTVRSMPDGTTKMEAVVEAVSQFLTWYNDSFSN